MRPAAQLSCRHQREHESRSDARQGLHRPIADCSCVVAIWQPDTAPRMGRQIGVTRYLFTKMRQRSWRPWATRRRSASGPGTAQRIRAERPDAMAPAMRGDWHQSEADADLPPEHSARPRCPGSSRVECVEVVADGSGHDEHGGRRRRGECWPKWVVRLATGASANEPRQRG
jgi:hypothetical protein